MGAMVMDFPGKPEASAFADALSVARPSSHKHVARPDCARVPPTLLQGLLGGIDELGASSQELLRQVGCDAADVNRGPIEPALFIRATRVCHEYLRSYIERTDRGSSLTAGQLVLLSKCLIGCTDLRDAIGTTAQFFEMLGGRHGCAALTSERGLAHLSLATVVGSTSAAALSMDLCNIVLLHKLYEWLIDATIPLAAAELSHPHPQRSVLHLSLLSCPARFGRPATRLTFAAGALEQPVARRPAELSARLTDFPFCLLAGERQRTALAEHVYRAMVDGHMRLRKVPSVDEVARRFGVTSWTLRRRLTDEGTSYSSIRKRVQLSLATEFLRRSDLTINEVAELANFSDAGAFRRAFQQWTGHSPSAYREDVLHA
jgi:AraC-like DNA-binding protein